LGDINCLPFFWPVLFPKDIPAKKIKISNASSKIFYNYFCSRANIVFLKLNLKMKKYILLLLGTLLINMLPVNLIAQEKESPFSAGADIVSRYIWRGINLGGNAPHIQPHMDLTLWKGRITMGVWGSYSLGYGITNAEVDLLFTIKPVKWFSLTFIDYYYPKDTPFERNDYLNLLGDDTNHTREVVAKIGEVKGFPFWLMFAMNFHGVDGLDAQGNPYYAKYAELGYRGMMFRQDISFFAGYAPDQPQIGGFGWYGNNAGLINLGGTLYKSFTVGNKNIPYYTSLIFNHEANSIYFVFGLSF
jgi:hypothetical protein